MLVGIVSKANVGVVKIGKGRKLVKYVRISEFLWGLNILLNG